MIPTKFKNRKERAWCFRPLTGLTFLNNSQFKVKVKVKVKFPSPYGVNFLKSYKGVIKHYKPDCFRPLTGLTFLNKKLNQVELSTTFPSPYGVNFLKLGTLRLVNDCLFPSPYGVNFLKYGAFYGMLVGNKFPSPYGVNFLKYGIQSRVLCDNLSRVSVPLRG